MNGKVVCHHAHPIRLSEKSQLVSMGTRGLVPQPQPLSGSYFGPQPNFYKAIQGAGGCHFWGTLKRTLFFTA